MVAWEYRQIRESSLGCFVQEANRLGTEGWEMVGFEAGDGHVSGIMKRPVREHKRVDYGAFTIDTYPVSSIGGEIVIHTQPKHMSKNGGRVHMKLSELRDAVLLAEQYPNGKEKATTIERSARERALSN